METNIEMLYQRYAPMVLRRCRYMLGDERANDAMQETFVKLLVHQHSLTFTYPSSLLYTMATNVCLNMIRSEKRRRISGSDDLIALIASDASIEERAITNDQLARIFDTEGSLTRTIATLHYVDNMTLEETAEAVQMSVSGVRKRLRKLRATAQHLEQQIEQHRSQL